MKNKWKLLSGTGALIFSAIVISGTVLHNYSLGSDAVLFSIFDYKIRQAHFFGGMGLALELIVLGSFIGFWALKRDNEIVAARCSLAAWAIASVVVLYSLHGFISSNIFASQRVALSQAANQKDIAKDYDDARAYLKQLQNTKIEGRGWRVRQAQDKHKEDINAQQKRVDKLRTEKHKAAPKKKASLFTETLPAVLSFILWSLGFLIWKAISGETPRPGRKRRFQEDVQPSETPVAQDVKPLEANVVQLPTEVSKDQKIVASFLANHTEKTDKVETRAVGAWMAFKQQHKGKPPINETAFYSALKALHEVFGFTRTKRRDGFNYDFAIVDGRKQAFAA